MSCKARLGLTGKKRLQDKDSGNGRSANPPYAAVDVVRVVQDVFEIKRAMRANSL